MKILCKLIRVEIINTKLGFSQESCCSEEVKSIVRRYDEKIERGEITQFLLYPNIREDWNNEQDNENVDEQIGEGKKSNEKRETRRFVSKIR